MGPATWGCAPYPHIRFGHLGPSAVELPRVVKSGRDDRNDGEVVSTAAPQPCQPRVRAKYCIAGRSSPSVRIAVRHALGARARLAMPAAGAMPGPLRGRLFSCAHCRLEVLVCIGCDRGRRYCGSECSAQARRQAQHATGKRYQSTRAGSFAHARRARRYRQRERERLAQSSPPPLSPLLPPSPSPSPPRPPPSPNRDASVDSQAALCRRCTGDGVGRDVGPSL